MINIITIKGKRYSRKLINHHINLSLSSLNDNIDERYISDTDLIKEYELICNKKSQMSSSERKWIVDTFFDRFEEIREEFIQFSVPEGKRMILVGGRNTKSNHILHEVLESVTQKVPLNDEERHIYILSQRLLEITKFIENGNQIMEEIDTKEEFIDNFNYVFEMQKTYIENELKYLNNDYNLTDINIEEKDIMSLEDFVKCCDTSTFIDNDGFGHYAVDNKETNIRIYPSQVKENKYLRSFPQIIWYNK